MRHLLGFSLLLTTALVAADDKPADKAVKKAPEEKRVPLGTLTGVIQSYADSNRELVVRVPTQVLEASPKAPAAYARQQQQILQRQATILDNTNPVQRQQQMQQLHRSAANLTLRLGAELFQPKELPQEITVTLTEDAKIRTTQPPEAFDEKGNIKRYTAQDLRKLRGSDPGVPGFPATAQTLETGRVVVVRLVRKVGPPAAVAKEKEKEKDKEKVKEKDKADSELYSHLVVVGADREGK